jgi:hypothetical protein
MMLLYVYDYFEVSWVGKNIINYRCIGDCLSTGSSGSTNENMGSIVSLEKFLYTINLTSLLLYI